MRRQRGLRSTSSGSPDSVSWREQGVSRGMGEVKERTGHAAAQVELPSWARTHTLPNSYSSIKALPPHHLLSGASLTVPSSGQPLSLGTR